MKKSDAHILLDPEDAWLLETNWRVKDGYAYRKIYTHKVRKSPRFKDIPFHRIIMGLGHGSVDKRQVDHINRNKLDNRRDNLRVVSKAQNAQNVGAQRRNKSGLRGAQLHKPSGRWRAIVRKDGRLISLGYHDTPQAAYERALAYRREHMPFAID